MLMATKIEYQKRITNLQDKLNLKELDGALIVYPIDIFYFAGTRQNALLWVPANGNPTLLVRKSLIRAEQECSIDDLRPLLSNKELPGIIGTEPVKIGLTFDVLPVQQFNLYNKLLPGKEFFDVSAIIREIRSVKSSWEIEQMRNSANKMSQVFAQIPQFLKPGMREIDAAAEFESRCRRLGHEGYIRMRSFNQELYWGLAVSGGNASYPGYFDGPAVGKGLSKAFPVGATTDIIKENVPIIFDFVAVFNGYMIDMTRMFAFGSLDAKLKETFAVAISIQQHLVDNLKPGKIGGELYNEACQIAESAGLSANFMGLLGEQSKFVGHGVGLELDELPVLALGVKAPLIAGQTIALEPKFAFAGQGVVGIENTFVVDESGGVKLTELDDAIIYL